MSDAFSSKEPGLNDTRPAVKPEPDFVEKLIAQLDLDQPRWYLEWATSNELLRYSEMSIERLYRDDYSAISRVRQARINLKEAVARRLFHRILNASIGAGIMQEV